MVVVGCGSQMFSKTLDGENESEATTAAKLLPFVKPLNPNMFSKLSYFYFNLFFANSSNSLKLERKPNIH